jgi:hypothetical protein
MIKVSSVYRVGKLVAVMVGLAGVLPAPGALLVQEGFDGYEEGALDGQSVRKTIGLTGSYYASEPAIEFQSTGLTFGPLAVSGGSIRSASATPAFAGVNLDAAGKGTIYSAYLVNFDGKERSDASAVRLGINDNPGGSLETRYFNSNADGSDSGVPMTGYDTVPSAGGYYANFDEAGTFLVLARFTNVGSELSPESPGVATMWILTEEQFAYLTAHHLLTDAGLDAAARGTAADNVRWRIENTVMTGSHSFTGALQLSLTSSGSSSTFTMDEIRFGTSLADVAPVAKPTTAAIPLRTSP